MEEDNANFVCELPRLSYAKDVRLVTQNHPNHADFKRGMTKTTESPGFSGRNNTATVGCMLERKLRPTPGVASNIMDNTQIDFTEIIEITEIAYRRSNTRDSHQIDVNKNPIMTSPKSNIKYFKKGKEEMGGHQRSTVRERMNAHESPLMNAPQSLATNVKDYRKGIDGTIDWQSKKKRRNGRMIDVNDTSFLKPTQNYIKDQKRKEMVQSQSTTKNKANYEQLSVNYLPNGIESTASPRNRYDGEPDTVTAFTKNMSLRSEKTGLGGEYGQQCSRAWHGPRRRRELF